MRANRQLERLLVPIARFAASLAALALLGLCAAAPASAVSFTRAWGWGVADGQSQFETCTITCQLGVGGGGAGQLFSANGVAVHGSDVFVVDSYEDRVNEFSSSGAFIEAWGWGVADGQSHFETCTLTCEAGLAGGGAGQLDNPYGVAVDGSGDVFVTDAGNNRVDEFSAAGAFIKAWGWGVLDGKSQLETCTTTCEAGLGSWDAGQLNYPEGIAVDGSGDVFIGDNGNERIDEFSTAGAFVKAWGWGVLDAMARFETCTTTCTYGQGGGGAGALGEPQSLAVGGSGDVFVADDTNFRVDEFSTAGVFVKAWGWGVLDGKNQSETCTITCATGVGSGGAGAMVAPDGIAVDGSGDVFVSDEQQDRVNEFSTAGAFIEAWGWGVADGQDQFETCTTSCGLGAGFEGGIGGGGAGQFQYPEGIAVDGSGDVFVADGARVDEFGPASVTEDTLTVSLAGSGSGSVTSSPAGISCPGTCSHSYASATMITLTATPAAGSTFAGWSGADCSGTGTCAVTMGSDQGVTATFNTSSPAGGSGSGPGATNPPSSTKPPSITGTAKAGVRLSCLLGGWSNDPTSVKYQWYRNGTLLAGFTGPSYTLGTLDEGTTITCVVTASNAAGSASAQSNAVKVPVPVVARCPAATGSMTGTTIGLVSLGMTRARARYLYRHHSDHGKRYEDFFCLTPIGVRVGYASPILLRTLSAHERARLTGRVVWASVSNPYYSLDGVRAGESIITAAAVLGTEPPFHIGLNYWYLARKPGYTAVLKVRGSVVEELGIASNALTTTRRAQSVLMHSFY